MIILCNSLLSNDRVHAIPADSGKMIKPKPVIDTVIEVDVAPIKKTRLLILILCLEFHNFYTSFWIYGF